MLLGALAIGLLTAYYLGLRPGMYAAAGAAALFFLAAVLPGSALPIYGLVGAGVVGLCLIGPKLKRPASSTRALGWLRAMAANRFKQSFGSGKKPAARPPQRSRWQ